MVKKEQKDQYQIIWEAIIPFLTKEAHEKLSNLKIAHEDLWKNVILILYQNVQAGRISKITSSVVEDIINKIRSTYRRETKIKFKRV